MQASWDKTLVAADGEDEAVLAPLPIPCTLVVEGEEVVVDDGDFEFSADEPGIYDIEIAHVEHLTTRWEVEAR